VYEQNCLAVSLQKLHLERNMTKKTFISISQNRKQGKGNFKATRYYSIFLSIAAEWTAGFLAQRETFHKLSLLSTRPL
jgi:hypothetical protein